MTTATTAPALDLDAGLLRAVLLDPADDAPRLQLADWLEERGQVDYAEFIRVGIQIEDPTLPRCNCFMYGCGELYGQDDGHGCEPHKQQVRLFRLHRRLALKVAEVPLFAIPEYRRGFIDSITCTESAFLRYAADLFARHPIRRVTLTGKEPLRGFGGWSWFDEDQPWNPPDQIASDIHATILRRMGRMNREMTVAFFDSPQDALDALSAACVSLGREQAGLPPLTAPESSSRPPSN